MADEDKGLLLAEFTSVTGADPERSEFYMSLAGWDLQIALSSFYDEEQEDIVAVKNDNNVHDVDYEPEEEPAEEPSPKQPKMKERGKITTFSNFEEEEVDSDEEGQAFYAGGSEHSGQQIVGPPRKKKDGANLNDMTQNIFDAAKRHGAEVVDPSKEQERKNKKGSAFRGSGYRLGETVGESSVISSTSSNNVESSEPAEVTLTFWSNGFSIDDGPLRDANAPENQEFLASCRKGEIPRELLRLNRGGEVHVNMVDKRNEDFVKPKETIKAFSGAGHKLGSPAPKVVGCSKNEASPVQISSSSALPKTPPAQVDNAAPMTNIQIRLADGTRLVSKFNHSHKISDVRNFVTAPQAGGRHFVLMTTFPNKELTDEDLTLEEAKLLNAVIVQRLK